MSTVTVRPSPALRKIFRAIHTPAFPVRPRQLHVLIELAHLPGASTSVLAHHCQISGNHVLTQLERLAAYNLITLKKTHTPGTDWVFRITDTGYHLLDTLNRVITAP